MPEDNRTPEERIAAAEQIAKDAQTERDAFKAQKEIDDKELNKLRDKDFNFKRLRDMTDEEKDKLTEVEKNLKAKQEKLDEGLSNLEKANRDSWKNRAIDKLSAGDKDLAKQIDEAFGRISGDPKTESEFQEHAAEAAALVKAKETKEQFRSALGITGSAPQREEKKAFSDTDDGKGLASMLGLGIAKVKDDKK